MTQPTTAPKPPPRRRVLRAARTVTGKKTRWQKFTGWLEERPVALSVAVSNGLNLLTAFNIGLSASQSSLIEVFVNSLVGLLVYAAVKPMSKVRREEKTFLEAVVRTQQDRLAVAQDQGQALRPTTPPRR